LVNRVHNSGLPRQIGRYQVSRELGKGAMGRVLLCHDPVLDRDVAVKHLRADLPVPAEQRAPLIERMRQEARASARVSHPNLVALHDMGEDARTGLFLVFEYVAGQTLKQRLNDGRLPPEQAARLSRELGSALQFAHEAGVVHRDIKPENVMLSPTGAKVADFGIARIPDSTLTQGGSILGTPAYSAPEAIRSGRFSAHSDQFSLAATLYEAISGQRAFPGDDAVAVATLITNDHPAPFAGGLGLALEVDLVLTRALSKNPKDRYSNCEEFGRTLAEALRANTRATLPTLPDSFHRVESEPSSWLKPFGWGLGLGALGLWLVLRHGTPEALSNPATDSMQAPPEEVIAPTAWLYERKPVTASSAQPMVQDSGAKGAQ
jgi:serine/threonine protein kinase